MMGRDVTRSFARPGRSPHAHVGGDRAAPARHHAVGVGARAAGREPVARLSQGGRLLAARRREAREPHAQDRNGHDAGAERHRLHAVGIRGRLFSADVVRASRLPAPSPPMPKRAMRCAASSPISARSRVYPGQVFHHGPRRPQPAGAVDAEALLRSRAVGRRSEPALSGRAQPAGAGDDDAGHDEASERRARHAAAGERRPGQSSVTSVVAAVTT